MKHRADVLVKCPYYKFEQRQMIYCEGIQDGTALHLAFDTPANLKDYKQRNCNPLDAAAETAERRMTMALRKIALMHRLFGVCEGHVCRECSNLVKGRYHDRILTKCKVYGLTHSEASDWAGRWQACGMFNKTWDKQLVMREVVPERKQKEADNTPLEGQIGMEGLFYE